MNRPTRIFLLFVVAAAVALLLGRGRGPGQPASDSQDAASAIADVHKSGSANAQQRQSSGESSVRGLDHRSAAGDAAPPPAGSLEGTDVAGALLVDANGNFVATADALDMFEYFFSATGEETTEQIVARIRNEIDKRLGAPADQQARAFLDRYLLYRERGIAMGVGGETEGAELRAGFEKLRSLRREIFGEETARALFGDEEAQAEISISQREIAADPDLSDEEKAARIEELYNQLPEPLRKAHEQTMAVLNLRRDEEILREHGGDDAAIRALRVERFGEAAADRLEALDRENAAWDARLQDFHSERDRIIADKSLSAAAKDAAIAHLLQDRFDERERIRVTAIDEAPQ